MFNKLYTVMVTALEVPTAVYKIPRDVILSYNSKKRIGNYLIGKTIGEGKHENPEL